MRKNTSRLFFVLIAIAGLLTSQVFADLGLAQMAAQPQGASAVGQAVLTAAKAIYSNNTDPAVIKDQLITILNEAAATDNAAAIRYAIVAVLLAGGLENLTLSKAAINDSDVFTKYPAWTAATVAAAEALMKASGGAVDDKNGGDKSGGDKGGGDQELGGGDKELGGGDPTWFPFWDSFPSDNDLHATRI